MGELSEIFFFKGDDLPCFRWASAGAACNDVKAIAILADFFHHGFLGLRVDSAEVRRLLTINLEKNALSATGYRRLMEHVSAPSALFSKILAKRNRAQADAEAVRNGSTYRCSYGQRDWDELFS